MTDSQEIKEALRGYILAEFLRGESAENLLDDTALMSSKILDSLAVLNLVSFIEEQYGIEVEAQETSEENFDTIQGIASLVVAKLGAA